MAYEYLSVGSRRITSQGVLTPTGTGIRLYSVNMVLTGTTTPADAGMVFADAPGQATTTASANTTVMLTVFYDQSLPVGFGNWDSHLGLYFPKGLLIQTATAFNYATITYNTEL